VTWRGRAVFALWLIQFLCVVKYPLLTWGYPRVKHHTKAYREGGLWQWPGTK